MKLTSENFHDFATGIKSGDDIFMVKDYRLQILTVIGFIEAHGTLYVYEFTNFTKVYLLNQYNVGNGLYFTERGEAINEVMFYAIDNVYAIFKQHFKKDGYSLDINFEKPTE